jgi:Tol biopolymer transport system component
VQPGSFDLAVYTGRAFELYTVQSSVSTVVPCKVPAEAFSVAPNGRFLVISSHVSRGGMGLLYEFDLASGGLRQLLSQPFYFRTLARGERELYSDPAVSPDNRSVAFAVHSVSDNDSDDAVGLAGPLAVLDFGSGKSRVLPASEDIDGQGPAYINGPVWSSDGRRLLVAFEAGGPFSTSVGTRFASSMP